MISWILNKINRYKRPRNIVGGGEGCCRVVDDLGREVAWVWFSRPTSDMRLQYAYELQTRIESESNLKEIGGAENKAHKIHELYMKEICVPWSSKLFLRAQGFVDGKEKKIESMTKAEQFDFLLTYHSTVLVAMISIAFEPNYSVKKKF